MAVCPWDPSRFRSFQSLMRRNLCWDLQRGRKFRRNLRGHSSRPVQNNAKTGGVKYFQWRRTSSQLPVRVMSSRLKR